MTEAVTWGYVISCLCADRCDPRFVTAEDLVGLAAVAEPCFPNGLSLAEAQYMLEHRYEFMPAEDCLP